MQSGIHGGQVDLIDFRKVKDPTTFLHFEDFVLVKTSLFSIGVQTLLSRLGGYIGGGRTLF